MKFLFSLLFVLLAGIPIAAQTFKCLPPEIGSDDVAKVTSTTKRSGETITRKITVDQLLKKLKARCVKEKLVDRSGRSIRFYFLQGCWGNPPFNYQEVLDKQRTEIFGLKKKYTVIEMTCNPTGWPPQSVSKL